MKSVDIRNKFIEYFEAKEHFYVKPSNLFNPLDDSILFVNSGMCQFKDVFLDKVEITNERVVNSQGCLRLSGKHNDLDDVGKDKYHHTFFEMLGNWSFNSFWKKESIYYAYDLLINYYGLNKNDLWVTVFGGDDELGLNKDEESYNIWKELIDEEKILYFGKKENFWQMENIGPCGLSTEIHIDLRKDKSISAKYLVNKDHEEVIELWNIVFMEYYKNDNILTKLNKKYIDTGMGFERLCRVIQNVDDNYKTDCFDYIIKEIESISSIKYNYDENTDIAFRVISDHIRSIIMIISNNIQPSSNKEGYILRRLIRRAYYYGYLYLNIKTGFLIKLVDLVINNLSIYFNDIKDGETIKTIITNEEIKFNKILENGLKLINKNINVINDDFVFKLYGTHGIPIDIIYDMCKKYNISIDENKINDKIKTHKIISNKKN